MERAGDSVALDLAVIAEVGTQMRAMGIGTTALPVKSLAIVTP
jgi:hypothetical protein